VVNAKYLRDEVRFLGQVKRTHPECKCKQCKWSHALWGEQGCKEARICGSISCNISSSRTSHDAESKLKQMPWNLRSW